MNPTDDYKGMVHRIFPVFPAASNTAPTCSNLSGEVGDGREPQSFPSGFCIHATSGIQLYLDSHYLLYLKQPGQIAPPQKYGDSND